MHFVALKILSYCGQPREGVSVTGVDAPGIIPESPGFIAGNYIGYIFSVSDSNRLLSKGVLSSDKQRVRGWHLASYGIIAIAEYCSYSSSNSVYSSW
jgi:hypothetical protein